MIVLLIVKDIVWWFKCLEFKFCWTHMMMKNPHYKYSFVGQNSSSLGEGSQTK